MGGGHVRRVPTGSGVGVMDQGTHPGNPNHVWDGSMGGRRLQQIPGGSGLGQGPANALVAPLAASSVTDVDLEAAGSRRPVSQREIHEVGAAPGTPIHSPFPGGRQTVATRGPTSHQALGTLGHGGMLAQEPQLSWGSLVRLGGP